MHKNMRRHGVCIVEVSKILLTRSSLPDISNVSHERSMAQYVVHRKMNFHEHKIQCKAESRARSKCPTASCLATLLPTLLEQEPAGRGKRLRRRKHPGSKDGVGGQPHLPRLYCLPCSDDFLVSIPQVTAEHS